MSDERSEQRAERPERAEVVAEMPEQAVDRERQRLLVGSVVELHSPEYFGARATVVGWQTSHERIVVALSEPAGQLVEVPPATFTRLSY